MQCACALSVHETERWRRCSPSNNEEGVGFPILNVEDGESRQRCAGGVMGANRRQVTLNEYCEGRKSSREIRVVIRANDNGKGLRVTKCGQLQERGKGRKARGWVEVILMVLRYGNTLMVEGFGQVWWWYQVYQGSLDRIRRKWGIRG